jgi:hypothetical protein
MSQDLEPEAKRWWQTLPGLLTAAAGIITAFTGLLVAAHQVGCFSRNTPIASQAPPHLNEESSRSSESGQGTSGPLAASTASRQLTLPANSEVRSGEYVFKLLSARVAPYAPDKVSLRLTVRMTNNNRFDANFWAASFRLLVDGSLQAPANNLDELVASHSAKEGEIEFVIPANTSTVGLQMGDVGEGKPSISIDLRQTKS